MKSLKIFGKIILSIFVIIYALFLILPYIITPMVQNYIPQIKEEITKATGLNSDIDGFKVITTPKLTAGVEVKQLTISTPKNEEIFNTNNFQIKMSLIPLFAKKIRVDLIQADSININLGLNKNGSFEIEKYLPKQDTQTQTETTNEPVILPFGLKLSNHLPDIKIGKYSIIFKDISASQNYEIKGNKIEITDFIFNRKVKLVADGKITLQGREQFSYDINILNKIMPETDFHELVFNPEKAEETPDQNAEVNILDIFKNLYKNQITLNLDTNIKTSKHDNNIKLVGYTKLDNLSVAPNGLKLPASNIDLIFKGSKIDIKSDIYTAKNEKSTISGDITTGKSSKMDLNVKSQAELTNLMKIINAVAMTFNIKDLQTLSAKGKIDADFNIKSDFKKVNSNGYFKIPLAQVYYGVYNIGLNNINADIVLNNNNINIKNVGFSIFNQPVKLFGTIKDNSDTDLHITSQNANLRGLLIALGQATLLKENNVKSGTISMNVNLTGKLDAIKPTAKVNLNNLDVKNVPSDTTIKLPNTTVDFNADSKTFAGKIISSNIKAINPAIVISIPKLETNVNEEKIIINKTNLLAGKNNLTLNGEIKDYLKEKMSINIATAGNINSTLSGDMNLAKGTMNLNFSAPKNNQIVVPMFDKSKMIFRGNTTITGNMTNPILNGSFEIPSLNMPEIPMTIDNMSVKLNGAILNGNATVGKFTSGGIVASNLSSTLAMKGENFYLNNIKGTAFNGNIAGNITYNMANTKTSIVFSGDNMDAEKTIAGAVGIKNALSGTLNFDTKLTLLAQDYNKMIKSMNGNFNFKIQNGSFGTIGRFENLLSAGNVIANSYLKSAVSTVTTLTGVKDTAKFNYVDGALNFANGWAYIKPIKSSGPTLAYYVNGRYNILNGTANVVVLGRLDSTIVALLGPLGDMSASKLVGYIPKIGSTASIIVKSLTTNPKAENTTAIPKLGKENATYKDFKVVYNGGLESKSSIKSFQWLTVPDTSLPQTPQVNVVDTINKLKNTSKEDIKKDLQNTIKDTLSDDEKRQKLIENSAKGIQAIMDLRKK